MGQLESICYQKPESVLDEQSAQLLVRYRDRIVSVLDEAEVDVSVSDFRSRIIDQLTELKTEVEGLDQSVNEASDRSRGQLSSPGVSGATGALLATPPNTPEHVLTLMQWVSVVTSSFGLPAMLNAIDVYEDRGYISPVVRTWLLNLLGLLEIDNPHHRTQMEQIHLRYTDMEQVPNGRDTLQVRSIEATHEFAKMLFEACDGSVDQSDTQAAVGAEELTFPDAGEQGRFNQFEDVVSDGDASVTSAFNSLSADRADTDQSPSEAMDAAVDGEVSAPDNPYGE